MVTIPSMSDDRHALAQNWYNSMPLLGLADKGCEIKYLVVCLKHIYKVVSFLLSVARDLTNR